MAKKKSKRKVSTKTKAKRFARGAKKAVKRVGKKVGRKAKPLGKKVKQGAKRVGKKAKKLAKSDAGRAGIGAGAGALLLGPVGAVAGAATGLATRNPKQGRKRNVSAFDPGQFDRPKTSRKGESSKVRGLPSPGSKLARAGLRPKDKARLALEQTEAAANPEPQVKISSVMGSMLFDYHKASPAIEHVAASAFRSERVPLSIVEHARADLRSLYKIQSQAAEREQIRDLIDSFDVVIRKAGHSMARKNPARAFSLDAQVKSMRRGKAKKAAMGMASQSKVYSEVKGKSLTSRLRKINPGASAPSMLDKLTGDYRKARGRWLSISTKAGSTEGEVARAKKRMDDAEDKLVMYADIKNLSPKDLQRHIESQVKLSNPGPVSLRHVSHNATLQEIRNVVIDNVFSLKRHGITHDEAMRISIENIYNDIPNVNEKTGRLIQSNWPDPRLNKAGQKIQYRRWKKRILSNPLAHISKGAGIRKIRSVVSQNTATEMDAGKPQKQAVAIAISSAREDADRIGGATAKLIRAEYPSLNPKSVKKLTKIPKGVKVKRVPPGKAEGAELPGEWMQERKPSRPAPVPKGIGVRAFNPKGKVKRKVTPEWQRLNRRCQKLWEHYCERPGKARLKDVFRHLKKMEGHESRQVKEEMSRCMRAAKAEAKRLKMKV